LNRKEAVMLILSRRPGEQLLIGDDILVKVLEISGTQVRLGITAPREVHVLREELLDVPPGGQTPSSFDGL
jgi:carbon storage regulator